MAIPQSRYIDAGSSATMADINRLTQEIRQIVARLDNHIGSGGNSHRAANDQAAGFLSVEDRARYEAAAAAQVETGGDTLASAGIYTGASYGVVGGIGVDESRRILDAINAVGPNGGTLIIRAATPGDPIYINSPIPIETSNLVIKFTGTLLAGPGAMVRINGGLKEILRTERGQEHTLKLRAASYADGEGRLVLPLESGGGAFLNIGDRVVIRGQNDKYGKAFSKQVTTIIAIAGDDATCSDEPDETYQPTYPDSDWPSDLTTGTTIAISAYSPMTVDYAGRTSSTLTVANTSYFTVGDLCYISDDLTEEDLMVRNEPTIVTNLRSRCNMEIARLVAKTETTLTFDRHIERPFLVADGAGVAVMDPVRGSHIEADVVRWDAPQPDRKNSMFAINYSEACSIKASWVDGKAGRLGAAGRIGYSYDCHILQTRALDAYRFESAEGYGLTLYYSTNCSIKNCYAVGNRHNYLVQACTLWDISENYSGDDYISGIDVHGANSVKGRISNNIVTRSTNHAPGVTNGGGIRIGNTSHSLGDHETVVENNLVVGYQGNLHCALDVSPCSRDTVLSRNTLMDCTIGLRHYKVNSGLANQHANKITMLNCLMIRVANPLDVENYDGNSYWDELVIKDTVFDRCGPIVVWDIPKVFIKGCDVDGAPYVAGGHAFEFRGIQDLRVFGCCVDGAARGVFVKNCGTAKIVRNWLGDTVEGIAVTDDGGNTLLIDHQNDYGVEIPTLINGGAFSSSTTDTINGGTFSSSVTDTYVAGGF